MRIGIFSVADAYPDELERDIGQFYNELLDQAELADKLGFQSFWVAEHHFHQYGVIPRAALWLSAASQRTKRIQLGAAVVVLPFDNPIRTAEDYAMVDILSGGRLTLGVGSGYLQHEFQGFGIDPQEKRDRFNESLEVLELAWSGQPVRHQGRYHSFTDLTLNVSPVQKPTPPLAVAVLNSEAAKFVGESGRDLMMIPYATSPHARDLAEPAAAYHAASRKRNKTGSGKLYFALHSLCGDTNDEAIATSAPCLERYVRTRLYARQRSFEELAAADLLAIGDSHYITQLLQRYEDMGFTDFLALTNFGGMPHREVCKSMERMAQSILPSSRIPHTDLR